MGSKAISKVLCISGLDAVAGYCGWETLSAAEIADIKDEQTRIIAQKLLIELSKRVVYRNGGDTTPGSEAQWLCEACRSHQKDFPIARLIYSGSTECPCDISSYGIAELPSSGCFNECDPSREICGDFNEQMRNIESVIRHSEFIDLVVPRVSDLNEGPTEAIVKMAADISAFEGASRLVTIHTELSEGGRSDAVADGIKRKLSSCKGNLEVFLKPWTHNTLAIERRLIGGRLGQGEARPRGARWGVHFSHLPLRGERVGRDTFRTWSVIDARTAQKSLDFLHHSSESKRVQKISI